MRKKVELGQHSGYQVSDNFAVYRETPRGKWRVVRFPSGERVESLDRHTLKEVETACEEVECDTPTVEEGGDKQEKPLTIVWRSRRCRRDYWECKEEFQTMEEAIAGAIKYSDYLEKEQPLKYRNQVQASEGVWLIFDSTSDDAVSIDSLHWCGSDGWVSRIILKAEWERKCGSVCDVPSKPIKRGKWKT